MSVTISECLNSTYSSEEAARALAADNIESSHYLASYVNKIGERRWFWRQNPPVDPMTSMLRRLDQYISKLERGDDATEEHF